MEESNLHGSLSALWDPHSGIYSQFRPRYPRQLLQDFYDFAELKDGRMELALDVGCGNGQVTVDLAQDFASVVGLDPSASQLQHALQAPNVSYEQRPAEATGLPSQSVDLLTAATCMHWFDLRAFYREARRVLRPSGALATWGYFPSSMTIPDCPEADAVLQQCCRRLWGYFHPALVRCMESGYAGLEPTAAESSTVKAYTTEMRQDMTLHQVVGYVHSWSSTAPFVAQHGQQAMQELLQQLGSDLEGALQRQGLDPQAPLRTAIKLEVILAKGPVPLEQ